MMRAACLLACALSSAAFAQTALFTGSPEQRINDRWDLGAVPSGDPLQTSFRIRNVGAGPVSLTYMRLAGMDFWLAGVPRLPQTLAPGAAIDFQVNFTPAGPGLYSASLEANGISVMLIATAVVASPVWIEENGGLRALSGGANVDFGSLERGAAASRHFLVENRTAQTLSVDVAGDAFRASPVVPDQPVPPGGTGSFDITFEAQAAGLAEGALQVGPRRFVLRGIALEPPLPKPTLVVALRTPFSGTQGSISVSLAEVSRTTAEGTVELNFTPAVAGATDPAIVFASGGRTARFTVREGDKAARFGTRDSVDFQTGTTAGTITLTLSAGAYSEQQTVLIPPAPPGIASAKAARAASSAQVEITGYDNTRSAGQLSFTFYDRNGVAVPPGAIKVDASAAFGRHFESSDVGGSFLLQAIFPVAGSIDLLDAVQVELTNSSGVARTSRLRLQP